MRALTLLLALGALVLAIAWFAGGEERTASTRAGDAGRPPTRPRESPRLIDPEDPPPRGAPGDPSSEAVASVAGEGAAPTEPARPRATPLSLVYGNVTDEGGAALEAYLSFTDRSGERTSVQASGGRYSVAGLASGSWTVACGLQGYEGKELEFDLESETDTQRLDVVLTRSLVISIRFETPDGEDLLEAVAGLPAWRLARSLAAVVTREPPPQAFPMTTADSAASLGAGHYGSHAHGTARGLSDRYHGRLQFDGDPPIFVSACFRHFVLETVRVEERVEELVFQLDPAAIAARLSGLRARLVDADSGAPVTGRVSLTTSQYGDQGVAAGADGRIEITGKLPGRMRFTVLAPGYATVRRLVEIPSGGLLDLGDYPLHRPVSIALRVIEPGGDPVTGMNLMLDPWVPGDPAATIRSRGLGAYRTGEDGWLRIENLRPDRWFVRPVWDGTPSTHGFAAFVVDTRGGEPIERTLELTPVTRISLDFEQDLDRIGFYVLDDQGFPQLFSRFYRGSPATLHLVPGGYLLRLVQGDQTLREVEFTVGANDLELPLSR